MTAITHVLGTGYRCLRFGEQIHPNPLQKGWQIGDSIGVLLSPASNPVSYAVGSKDCNEPCSPSASSAMGSSRSMKLQEPQTNAPDAG